MMAKKYDLEKAKREIESHECFVDGSWYRVLNAMQYAKVEYADVAEFLNMTEEKLIKRIRSTRELLRFSDSVEIEKFCSRKYNSRLNTPCLYIDLMMNACECSECGEDFYIDANGRYNFCPNCGADMRGEQE